MGICITIKYEDTPKGFENFLRRYMARYYRSVEIRFGDIESIVLDGSPSGKEKQTAWMLLEAAGTDYYDLQLQLA